MTYFAEIAALSYEDREIVAQVMAEAVTAGGYCGCESVLADEVIGC